MTVYDETLSQGIGFDETQLYTGWLRTLSQGVGFDELLPIVAVTTLSDTIGTVVYAEPARLQYVTLSQGVGLTDTLGFARGVHIRDALNTAPSLAVGWKANAALSESLGFARVLATARPVTLTSTVGVAGTQLGQLAVTLSSTLGLDETMAGAAAYRWSFSDGVALSETLARGTGAMLSETLGLDETIASLRYTQNALTDTVAIAATLSPRLVLRAVLDDEVGLEHSDAVRAIYHGLVSHGIEFSAEYISPEDGFTTWAINTRTAAVSEYTSFVFNSLARVGNRYVGASSTGLYWLDGDDDVGEDIVARLKGGWLQFGGTHLSRLKAAYIATRGDAEFILRIETGEGARYDYEVTTRSMRSTKVHMGKGQRSRYFSFELIGDGGDFDLETLEFVPIAVQRRV